MNDHILYTYQTVADPSQPSGGRLECHAYGPASQDQAAQTGVNLQRSASEAKEPTLGYMVLALEAMPV